MHAPSPPSLSRAIAAALIGSLGASYAISQFSRNAVGVVAPDLARELGLAAAEIGLLSSLFFLTFAAAQIPLGIIIDRQGPKRVMLACFALTILGTAVVSLAPGYLWLLVGRALLGLGCSSFLIAPLVIYAREFPAERYSSLASLHLAIGNGGTICATAPLAFAAAALGWRGAYALVAIVAVICAALVLVLVGKDQIAPARAGAAATRLRDVARAPSFWLLMGLQCTTYPTFAAIGGLWGGPWLADVYGYDLGRRGATLLILVIAHIVGLFVWSALDRRLKSYKRPLLAAGALVAATLAAGALFTIPEALIPLWLACFGFGLGYAPLMMGHARMLFPPETLGRGLTLLNAGNMAGAFAIQTITGLIVGAFPRAPSGAYPAAAYAAVMGLLAVQLAAALLLYAKAPDAHPGRTAA
ncbi:MFS transporter [Terrarubrum flagellatum]|uniref:MFS transporter n=1 Tax=Terrirubrum flagellatum TaxID=2895980 RepID=UPI0031451754